MSMWGLWEETGNTDLGVGSELSFGTPAYKGACQWPIVNSLTSVVKVHKCRICGKGGQKQRGSVQTFFLDG